MVEEKLENPQIMWKLNNIFFFFNNTLKQPVVQRKNHKEIRKHFETNENKTKTYENIQDTAKEVVRGIFIAVCVYIFKKEVY